MAITIDVISASSVTIDGIETDPALSTYLDVRSSNDARPSDFSKSLFCRNSAHLKAA